MAQKLFRKIGVFCDDDAWTARRASLCVMNIGIKAMISEKIQGH
jgi:hypothetical protein